MEYEYIKRIEKKTKQLNITVKKMLIDLGYSDSLISQWKRGSEPSMIKLQKIAEYLKMDIGYIITGNKTELSEDEKALLEKWNRLDPIEQELIQEKIDTLIEVKEKKQSKLSS